MAMSGGHLDGDAVEELIAVSVVHVLTTTAHQFHWGLPIVESEERELELESES